MPQALTSAPLAEAPATAADDAPDAQWNNSDHLAMLCRYFEEAENAQREARKLAERDRAYYDNKQWTAAESEILRRRKQPELTINHIKRKVEIQRGIERRNRRDPKAYPRNPKVDEQMADAATAALRFIKDQQRYDETRSGVHENLIIEGYGGADVIVKKRPDGSYDVIILQVPWDRLGYDPHSRMPDFSDARYKFIVIWKDSKRDANDVYGQTLRMSSSDTYDDRPHAAWVDSSRKRVREVQMHYLHDGKWMVATFTRAGFVPGGEPMVSPYLDEFGEPQCSLIMRHAYCDQENNRYGDVRAYISLQDEINKRRSKALHLLSVRQSYGNTVAVQDAKKAKEELAKPDGHLEINNGAQFGKDFGLLDTGNMVEGQFRLYQQSVLEMNSSGPNAALAGKAPGQQSGRALEAQIEGGSVEIEPLVDSLRQFDYDVWEQAWLRVRQFWTAEKWVRITDDERNVKFVGLNHKVTLGEDLAALREKDPEAFANQVRKLGIVPGDPRLQQVVRVDNNVSGLDVDIIIEDGPNVVTMQAEAFETVTDLVRTGLPLANGKPVPLDAIVELSPLRNKDTWLKKWGGSGEKSAEAAGYERQLQEQGAQMAEMAKAIEALQAQLKDKGAEVAVKAAQAETQQFAAETDRIEAIAPAMTPQDVAAVVQESLAAVLGPFMERLQQAQPAPQPMAQPQQAPVAMPQEQMEPQPPQGMEAML